MLHPGSVDGEIIELIENVLPYSSVLWTEAEKQKLYEASKTHETNLFKVAFLIGTKTPRDIKIYIKDLMQKEKELLTKIEEKLVQFYTIFFGRGSNFRWTEEEREQFTAGMKKYGNNSKEIAKLISTRTQFQVRKFVLGL